MWVIDKKKLSIVRETNNIFLEKLKNVNQVMQQAKEKGITKEKIIDYVLKRSKINPIISFDETDVYFGVKDFTAYYLSLIIKWND